MPEKGVHFKHNCRTVMIMSSETLSQTVDHLQFLHQLQMTLRDMYNVLYLFSAVKPNNFLYKVQELKEMLLESHYFTNGIQQDLYLILLFGNIFQQMSVQSPCVHGYSLTSLVAVK